MLCLIIKWHCSVPLSWLALVSNAILPNKMQFLLFWWLNVQHNCWKALRRVKKLNLCPLERGMKKGKTKQKLLSRSNWEAQIWVGIPYIGTGGAANSQMTHSARVNCLNSASSSLFQGSCLEGQGQLQLRSKGKTGEEWRNVWNTIRLIHLQ